jgi:hypothetical protein
LGWGFFETVLLVEGFGFVVFGVGEDGAGAGDFGGLGGAEEGVF